MQICIDNTYFSFAADYNETESLLVRAKGAGDINLYWPDATVTIDAASDFAERAVIPRYKVAGLVSELILNNQCADLKPQAVGLGSFRNLQNNPFAMI